MHFICCKYKCVNMQLTSQNWEKSSLVFLFLPVKIRLADPYLNCFVHRLDGSAEPANEILEQTSHERPLVAQTYSTAIAKGKNSASWALSACLSVKSCITRARVCVWLNVFLQVTPRIRERWVELVWRTTWTPCTWTRKTSSLRWSWRQTEIPLHRRAGNKSWGYISEGALFFLLWRCYGKGVQKRGHFVSKPSCSLLVHV